MRNTIYIISLFLILSSGRLNAQSAPVTTFATITSCPGIDVEVPVTVSGFNGIGALSLTADFDPGVLVYQSFINNSNFPGLAVSGSNPGTIIAGGFSEPGTPGVTLPDDAVLFTLIFHYAGGNTALTWYDNGESCEYTDNLFNPLNDSPYDTYYKNGSVTPNSPEGAPITMIPAVQSCPGTTLDVPVTVSDFCLIGALSLTLHYDPEVLVFESFVNNSGFPGLQINSYLPGAVMAGGYINVGNAGVSLPDNTVLFTIRFQYLGGATDLSWFDNGESCEYTDQFFNPLEDTPSSAYYLDGSVTPFLPFNAPVTVAPHITMTEVTTVDIPITASDLCQIGAVSLTLNYNPLVLEYQSFENNSGFPGLMVNGSIAGSVFAGGYMEPDGPGFSMPDNAVLFTLTFQYLGGTTLLTWYDNGSSCEYADHLFNPLPDDPTTAYYLNGSVSGSVKLTLKAFLEGPFLEGSMTTILNDMGKLPHAQPYACNPWNYEGLESVGSIPGAQVVDWILVELRESSGSASTATGSHTIGRQAAFILEDGSVMAMNGNTGLNYFVTVNKNLYIVLHHRNHLSMISADPIPLTDNMGNYDFSSGEFQVLGGVNGCKELTPGTWGMAAGDLNADKVIDALDRSNAWVPQIGKAGYHGADANLDMQVNNPDKNAYIYKNLGKVSGVPD